MCCLFNKSMNCFCFEWVYFFALFPEMWTVNVIKCLKHFWFMKLCSSLRLHSSLPPFLWLWKKYYHMGYPSKNNVFHCVLATFFLPSIWKIQNLCPWNIIWNWIGSQELLRHLESMSNKFLKDKRTHIKSLSFNPSSDALTFWVYNFFFPSK